MMRQLRLVLVFAAVVVGCYYVGFLTASFFKHGCSLAAACGRLPQATHDLLAALGYVAWAWPVWRRACWRMRRATVWRASCRATGRCHSAC